MKRNVREKWKGYEVKMRSIFALNAVGFWKELIQKRRLTNLKKNFNDTRYGKILCLKKNVRERLKDTR